MIKMKDEYILTKEKESQLIEEIDKLKKKMNTQSSLMSAKQNKGNFILFYLILENIY